ncbi:hypothetical protein BT96DRAFT_951231 [Gymnopus androsaceus JB14]|uniref:Uncharacterized protein n=1 Tax=Gymnopus androsaceus JB14 TaxID=1447944 RepID=A0A6A4GDV6_9AGAR|nr:hypothetical protein BT96DRAFT_951231 [Gymnopus androsaceus JB14]
MSSKQIVCCFCVYLQRELSSMTTSHLKPRFSVNENGDIGGGTGDTVGAGVDYLSCTPLTGVLAIAEIEQVVDISFGMYTADWDPDHGRDWGKRYVEEGAGCRDDMGSAACAACDWEPNHCPDELCTRAASIEYEWSRSRGVAWTKHSIDWNGSLRDWVLPPKSEKEGYDLLALPSGREIIRVMVGEIHWPPSQCPFIKVTLISNIKRSGQVWLIDVGTDIAKEYEAKMGEDRGRSWGLYLKKSKGAEMSIAYKVYFVPLFQSGIATQVATGKTRTLHPQADSGYTTSIHSADKFG